MNYEKFAGILNTTIFGRSKAHLIEKIASEPNRYVGLFRPTKPKAKLLQNLLQSHEIRFGDAFEQILDAYLIEGGYGLLPKSLGDGRKRKRLELDLHFRREHTVFFLEIKVRDDHDSSKKTGQMDNFEKKLDFCAEMHGEKHLQGGVYFVDPELEKNRTYYEERINCLSKQYGVCLRLWYGQDFFTHLFPGQNLWGEIRAHLTKWRESLPEIPEINMDKDAASSFDELKDVKPGHFRKVFENPQLCSEILPILFPEGKTLRLLKGHFEISGRTIYHSLSRLLDDYFSGERKTR